MKMSLKLFYQYIAIFFNFSSTPSHLIHYKWLVVDEMTVVNSGSKGVIDGTSHTELSRILQNRNKMIKLSVQLMVYAREYLFVLGRKKSQTDSSPMWFLHLEQQKGVEMGSLSSLLTP